MNVVFIFLALIVLSTCWSIDKKLDNIQNDIDELKK